MAEAKVSVIIPVYNVENYLEECVQSVIKQTCGEIEIILVDDGSTDSSGKMCDDYAADDERIKVIHKINGGLGSARNTGIEASKGEYLLFLDSDDFLDRDAIRILYKTAKENDLDMVLFEAESFIDGEVSDDVFIGDYQTYKEHINEVMSGEECLAFSLHNRDYLVSNCMRLYARRIATFRYNEDIVHEDEDIGIYTFLLSDRVMRLDKPFYKRRYRAGSIMTGTNTAREAKGYMYAAMQMLDYYKRTESPVFKTLLLERFESYFRTVCEKYKKSTAEQKRAIKKIIKAERKNIAAMRLPIRKKTMLKIYIPELLEVGIIIRKLSLKRRDQASA